MKDVEPEELIFVDEKGKGVKVAGIKSSRGCNCTCSCSDKGSMSFMISAGDIPRNS
jgi:hypothetical protein